MSILKKINELSKFMQDCQTTIAAVGINTNLINDLLPMPTQTDNNTEELKLWQSINPEKWCYITVFGIETPNGERERHEYGEFIIGENIYLRVRWIGLLMAYSIVMRRYDQSGFCMALDKGNILFDKDGVIPSLKRTIKTRNTQKFVSAAELLEYRFKLHSIARLKGQNSLPDIKQAAEFFLFLSEAAGFLPDGKRLMVTLYEKLQNADMAFKGNLIVDFASMLLKRFGGSPPKKYYLPVDELHKRPFANKETSTEFNKKETVACSHCFKLLNIDQETGEYNMVKNEEKNGK